MIVILASDAFRKRNHFPVRLMPEPPTGSARRFRHDLAHFVNSSSEAADCPLRPDA